MERDHEGQNRETQWREIMTEQGDTMERDHEGQTGRHNGERS